MKKQKRNVYLWAWKGKIEGQPTPIMTLAHLPISGIPVFAENKKELLEIFSATWGNSIFIDVLEKRKNLLIPIKSTKIVVTTPRFKKIVKKPKQNKKPWWRLW